MVKPEWGTKRTCPKCGIRFYDLGQEDPVTCIECENEWTPEPVLKSKQPIPFDEQDDKKKKDAADKESDSDLGDDDLDDIDVDDDNAAPDADVDLNTNDDLGVDATKNDGDEVES